MSWPLRATHVLIVLGVAVPPLPQEQVRSDARLRAAVDLVTLHVSVVDERHRYLTGLRQSDFEVFEDGRRQRLKFFQQDGLPLTLAIVLDTSGSMEPALPLVKRGAVSLIERMRPQDKAAIIGFDDSVRVLQDWTADREALVLAVRRARLGNATSFYTAAYIALAELEKQVRSAAQSEPRRGALVLLSDGEDSASAISFDDLLTYVNRTEIIVYTVRLGKALRPGSPDVSAFELRRLAEQTGGRAFFPSAYYELEGIYEVIGTELSSQYLLAYESDSHPHEDGFRSLTVLVGRQDATARTRRGYAVRH
jgi:Ca-activated chloride channel family protein